MDTRILIPNIDKLGIEVLFIRRDQDSNLVCLYRQTFIDECPRLVTPELTQLLLG